MSQDIAEQEATPTRAPAREALVTYSFGDFTYDQLNGLRRRGREVRLGPHEHWLIARLLEGRGGLVRHENLNGGIFDTFLVGPGSLHRAVRSLRTHLGDRHRSVVVSVSGAGYRIGLPVAASGDPAPAARGEEGSGEYQQDPPQIGPGAADPAEATDRLARAIETAPGDARACVAYVDLLIRRMIRGYIRPASHADEAFEAADRALAADAENPVALAAKGWLCGVLDDDRYTGLKFVARARERDPASARVAFLGAWLLIAEQRTEEARRELERAAALNPFDHRLAWLRAWLMCARKQYGGACSLVERSLRSALESDFLWICDAVARVGLGERKSALNSIRAAAALSPRDWHVRASLGWVRVAVGGRFGYADLVFHLAASPGAYLSPVMSAILHHAMGDRASAAEFLRIARSDRDPWHLLAWCDPRLRA